MKKAKMRELNALVIQSKKLAANEEIRKATNENGNVRAKMSKTKNRDKCRRCKYAVGTVPGEILSNYRKMKLKTVCDVARWRATFKCKYFAFSFTKVDQD